jgi:hypothetical protein
MSGTVFISYSHKDEGWKDRLVEQLRVLELEGAYDLWDDLLAATVVPAPPGHPQGVPLRQDIPGNEYASNPVGAGLVPAPGWAPTRGAPTG